MASSTIPKRIFVTGTGTGIGKTVASAVLVRALSCDYWKPVQAGFKEGTDSEWISSVVSEKESFVFPEAYKLKMPASPHIAAREEGIDINLDTIVRSAPRSEKTLIIEGAGGLMVPVNGQQFVADLILKLDTPVILVSRNQLGSINHSLLTAMACRQKGIKVVAWIFNGDYLDYAHEIAEWTGIPVLHSIPSASNCDREFIAEEAKKLRTKLESWQW